MDKTRRVLTIGADELHVAGDAGCPECIEGFPETCACGGLVHGAIGESDVEGQEWPETRCDRCGRSRETAD